MHSYLCDKFKGHGGWGWWGNMNLIHCIRTILTHAVSLSFSVMVLCCRYFDWLFTQASSSMVDDDVKIYFLQALLEVRIACIWSVLFFH